MRTGEMRASMSGIWVTRKGSQGLAMVKRLQPWARETRREKEDQVRTRPTVARSRRVRRMVLGLRWEKEAIQARGA